MAIEVEVLQHRSGEQTEAQRREAEQHRLERADPVEARERGRERHRDRAAVVDDFSEHVAHLGLTSGRLGHAERDNRQRDRRQGQHEVRPAPTVAAAGERGDPAHDRGAQHRGQPGRTRDGRVHAPANGDRIRIRDERALHRVRVRFRGAGAEAGDEEDEGIHREAAREHHHREHRRGPADDRRAAEAVGEPSHRQRAEGEEGARRRGDEDDDAVTDMERVAYVRRQHRQGRVLELAETLEQREHHEA